MAEIQSFITAHEAPLRLGAFIGILGLVALVELLLPRRRLVAPKGLRWAVNLGFVVVNALVLRLLFPVLAVAFALEVASRRWGLFNRLDWPPALEFLIAVVALDFIIYVQHRLFHVAPLFWRIHRMHHVDRDIDVTTGLRFHPIEIVLSMVIKLGAVAALGPSAAAVILFEVILNGMAMFNHGNIRLPRKLDAVLRALIVTPDMHRVHHSVRAAEYNRNFGFNLSLWDRLFASYRAQPADGHEGMTIGQNDYQGSTAESFPGLFWLPFRSLPPHPRAAD